MDVNGDGVTDVLLVAAPMFLGEQSKETGRVYVYKVGPVGCHPLPPCPQWKGVFSWIAGAMSMGWGEARSWGGRRFQLYLHTALGR